MGMNQPLRGLRVVEFASFVAAPSAGMTLAQLGADVIKVDPLGGNTDYRRWPLALDSPDSLFWTSLNRGKRSVAVNMRTPEGQELVLALATAPGRDAGICVDNTVGRSWLSYEAMTARRTDMIAVHIEGRADGGAAVDYTVNSAVGIPMQTGPVDGGPVNHVLPAWDFITGQAISTAVLAALHRRERTGEGSRVEIALADVAAAGVANLGWYTEALQRGNRARHGNHLYGSFGTDFETADGGRVMVVTLSPRQWKSLGEATGLSAALAAMAESFGVDFFTDAGRYEHRDAIADLLRPWFAQRNFAEVEAALNAAGALWGPYQSMRAFAEAFRADPSSAPVLVEVDQPGVGQVISAKSPIRVDGQYVDAGVARSGGQGGSDGGGNGAPMVASALGADTDEILASVLGLSDAELAKLHDLGVI